MVATAGPLGIRRALSKLAEAALPTWWGRNFGIVFAGRVSMSVGRSLAGVVAPIYLALEGFSAFELSLYVLVVALSSAVLSTAVGLSSDKLGRRPYLIGVPLLTAGAAVGFAFTASAPLLFVLGALGSFGRGAGAGAGAVGPYQPAESAFISEDLPAEHRNAGFGRLTFGSSAGAMVGSLLALLVSSSHAQRAAATAAFRPAFLAVGAAAALAGLVAIGLVEPTRRQGSLPARQFEPAGQALGHRGRLGQVDSAISGEPRTGAGSLDGKAGSPEVPAFGDEPDELGDEPGALQGAPDALDEPDVLDEPEAPLVRPVLVTAGRGEAASSRGGRARRRHLELRLPVKSRWLVYRLLVTNMLNGMAIGMFGPFITYWFFRKFGAGAGEVGTLYAVINAATMVSSLSASGLARRWGLVRTVSIVRSLQALLLVPMVLAPTFALAGGIYFVRMFVQRIGLPLRQSYAIALAHPDERSSVAAVSNVPSQLAQAASPLLTGYLFDEVSLSLPFELAAALQFANALSFWGFFHNHPPEEERALGARQQGSLAPASSVLPPAGESDAGAREVAPTAEGLFADADQLTEAARPPRPSS